ncbi:two-component system sensor histidine kinase YesM [Clostridium saccharoperbutylacetonicum]|uniref:Integral membrane sensor signal transduction histidine kinase n=2 Tax=Clostridium saccharoperbutylacetonicum TaxID=36745 RepID=M1LRH4_9CLOT|nr:sensor histidine kinase [Clostridium saccharoperbutylacetonicum]AGF55540.1 integral membrane sensor signal transduction histidine kinase [Clostridium saccharoperbutylacetonicum N1-4(HMT)]NSB40589.1 two-component system sensor histidine kinase YesM [Clostridium saccharoperbutylacetonicum]
MIEKYFKIKTIKNRFLAVMIILIIFPIPLIGIISFINSSNMIENNHKASYLLNLQKSSELMDNNLKNTTNIMRSITSNENLRNELKSSNEVTEATDNYFPIQSVNVFSRIFREYTIDTTYIDSICLYDNDGRLYYFGTKFSGATVLKNNPYDKIKEKNWYKEAIKANGKEVILGYNILDEESREFSFSTVKLVRDVDTLKPIGLMIINVKENAFTKAFPNINPDSEEGTFLVLDKNKNNNNNNSPIVFMNRNDEDIKKIVDNSQEFNSSTLEKQGYSVSSYTNDITGWEIVHIIKKSQLLKDTRLIGVYTAIVCLVTILFALILSIVFSNTINKPIKRLKRAISDVGKGKRDITEEFGDDEIGILGNQFKVMVKENLELNERITSSKLKQREAELKLLQAQINPHFLYNTLDSIYWLAKIKKVDDIADMAIALSDIFKLSLNKGSEITTVRNEIKQVQSYLIIQNLRYKDRFKVDIDIDDKIMDYEIIKLIIQPFIENAMIHGLEPKAGDGEINIIGKLEGDEIVFVIEDNGIGVEDINKFNSGYGIKNVQERIELYYGEEYGVTFESEINKGTIVTIKIPFEKKIIL